MVRRRFRLVAVGLVVLTSLGEAVAYAAGSGGADKPHGVAVLRGT